jgi:hypothetical protein
MQNTMSARMQMASSGFIINSVSERAILASE